MPKAKVIAIQLEFLSEKLAHQIMLKRLLRAYAEREITQTEANAGDEVVIPASGQFSEMAITLDQAWKIRPKRSGEGIWLETFETDISGEGAFSYVKKGGYSIGLVNDELIIKPSEKIDKDFKPNESPDEETFSAELSMARRALGGKAHGYTSAGNKKSLIMRKVPGEPLDKVNFSALSFEQQILASIVTIEAIEDLHQKAIFHRDLKPANIHFDVETMTAHPVDFGSAIDMSTHQGFISSAGTSTYMPPELVNNRLKVEDAPKADAFMLSPNLAMMFCEYRDGDQVALDDEITRARGVKALAVDGLENKTISEESFDPQNILSDNIEASFNTMPNPKLDALLKEEAGLFKKIIPASEGLSTASSSGDDTDVDTDAELIAKLRTSPEIRKAKRALNKTPYNFEPMFNNAEGVRSDDKQAVKLAVKSLGELKIKNRSTLESARSRLCAIRQQQLTTPIYLLDVAIREALKRLEAHPTDAKNQGKMNEIKAELARIRKGLNKDSDFMNVYRQCETVLTRRYDLKDDNGQTPTTLSEGWADFQKPIEDRMSQLKTTISYAAVQLKIYKGHDVKKNRLNGVIARLNTIVADDQNQNPYAVYAAAMDVLNNVTLDSLETHQKNLSYAVSKTLNISDYGLRHGGYWIGAVSKDTARHGLFRAESLNKAIDARDIIAAANPEKISFTN